MKTRICVSCEKSKDVTEFYSSGKSPSGRPKYKSRCKSCLSDWQRDRHLARLSEMVELKCTVCGYNKISTAIDFHHLDPTNKDVTISAMTTYSDEKVFAEVQKCVTVCKNCHTELHAGLFDIEDYI